MWDDTGVELNAEFSVTEDAGYLAVVLESAGGAVAGSTRSRNSDYVPALELLLARLQANGAVIQSAVVASSRTAALAEAERSLLPDPVDLATVDDLAALRVRLTAAQGLVGLPAGAVKPGNNRKRILVRVAVPGCDPTQPARLGELLATGDQQPPNQEPYDLDDLLQDVAGLTRYTSPSGDTSVHKPVALLWAADRLAKGGGRLSNWPQFRREVGDLLADLGVNRTPQYPFWHLRSTPRLWEVHGLTDAPTTGDAHASAGFTRPAADLLGDAAARDRVANAVVDRYLAQIDVGWTGDRLIALKAQPAPLARDVLQPLVGTEIKTVTGAPNQVVGFSGDHVLVGTTRSPHGEPVPIADVQHGLDLITRHRRVGVNVDRLGHRSAFVGAVLATLPNARVSTSPATVELIELTAEAVADELAELDTADKSRRAVRRPEQGILRAFLADGRTAADCALCGTRYPIEFLVAAHVKFRSVCTTDERQDLPNVAMLACVFGCDALYEKGWITVDESGKIAATSAAGTTPGIAERAALLTGRRCAAHSPSSEPYFAWHRTTVFGDRESVTAE